MVFINDNIRALCHHDYETEINGGAIIAATQQQESEREIERV